MPDKDIVYISMGSLLNLIHAFDKEEHFIAPLYNNETQNFQKKYRLKNKAPNGWYLFTVKGNDVLSFEPTFPQQNSFPRDSIGKGYVCQGNFLFDSLDVAIKKFQSELMIDVEFLPEESDFTSVYVYKGRDGRFYYIEQNYGDLSLYNLKNYLDDESDISLIKGITPEQKLLYTSYLLEKINTKRMLELAKMQEEKQLKEKEMEEELKKMRESLPFRVRESFSKVGANVTDLQISNERIDVRWTLNGKDLRSIINAKTFRVIQAGFCMNDADTDHNIQSMVLTADDYIDRRVLHKVLY